MPFSIVYQITKDCIFDCDICHRRYEDEEIPLTPEARRQMILRLKGYGLNRLTITGGEPTLLGEELFDFLKFVHDQRIHTCLSTTGYQIDLNRLTELDGYLDQLLLPIRSLNLKDWEHDFGKTKYCIQTFENVINILKWVQRTNIILTVSTVIHRDNLNSMMELGWKLYELNPNIIWSIDEYYPMGKKETLRKYFELNTGEARAVYEQIQAVFANKLKRISFNDAQSRTTAPDYLITPSADLVTTSSYNYSKPNSADNILRGNGNLSFENRRPWLHYQRLCRDWGWDSFGSAVKKAKEMKQKYTFQIHHVAIQTTDFEKAFKFYNETLGFPVIKEPFTFKERTLAWLSAGNIAIELYSVKNGREPQPYNSQRVGTDHVAFEVDNLADVVAYLEEKGVKILKYPFLPPTNDPLQPKVAFIEGADGEEIELREVLQTNGGNHA